MTELSDVKDFLDAIKTCHSLMNSQRNALNSTGKRVVDCLAVFGVDKAIGDVTDADLDTAFGGRFTTEDKDKILPTLRGIGRNQEAHEITATEATPSI